MTLNQVGLYNPQTLSAIVERKGTLYLRSDHMKYNKGTLISEWHFKREAEPKDYDICNPEDGKRNLLRTTYKRIGNIDEASFNTTSHESMKEIETLKRDYLERSVHKPMVNQNNFNTTAMPGLSLEETTEQCLPKHSQDHNKQHLVTTHKTDYTWSMPMQKQINSEEENHAIQRQRTLSEFTDTENHRRKGFRIWQDEKN